MVTKKRLLLFVAAVCVLVVGLTVIKDAHDKKNGNDTSAGAYFGHLKEDASLSEPLEFIGDDFKASEEFTSNLPLVVLHLNEELAEYKKFSDSEEIVFDEIDPWTSGTISLYDAKNGRTSLQDKPVLNSDIRIKKRGHTSIAFDKAQYYIKLVDDEGNENPQNVFGMGKEDDWVLNGSMADKSMIRNYIAYRTAAQIMEYAPRCCFCEMFTEKNGEYTYQGVYLMMDKIKKSENRVNIETTDDNKAYSGYLIRRDRLTGFDTMLETYGRINEMDEGWIGVKYPAVSKQTEENLGYIQDDFSKVEKILYSKDRETFLSYGSYIDVDSFADYFLINEYFGNYDAGEHSTYMYKDAGTRLKIGPVWDFDQAMNNSVVDETDPLSLAMQEKTFYKQLFQDTEFLDLLKSRYADLRSMYLNDDYMFAMIDETEKYLKSARVREWYRWSADYLDNSGEMPGNYYLDDYVFNGETISRFNDNYDQEIYNIKVYLSKHGKVIQKELTKFYQNTTLTSGIKGRTDLILVIVLILFLIPPILINRK